MKQENRDQLCHILLTELLAYQFAWPVRWIETQDVIFNDFKTERFIEVGPQPILANMATRTLQQDNVRENALCLSGRQEVLASCRDLDKLYYQWEDHREATPQRTDAPENHVGLTSKTSQVVPGIASVGKNSFSVLPRLDMSLKLRSIICHKLPKYGVRTLPVEKSLKELCGGKSTLQNELKGDFIREIPSMSDSQIEDIPVSELCETVDETNSLGPVTSGLASRFVVRNFSSSLSNLSAVRAYLQSHWQVSDANALILYMSTQVVNQRFQSDGDTEKFIDQCCLEYASWKNIAVRACSNHSLSIEEDDERPKVIDIEEFNTFRNELTQLQKSQHGILGSQLGTSDSQTEVELLKAELAETKNRLSAIESEFDNVFLTESVRQLFSPKKIRIYDSAWNWGRQHVLQMVYAAIKNPRDIQQVFSEENVHVLLNRADTDIMRIIHYAINCLHMDNNVVKKLNALSQACLRSAAQEPFYRNSQFTSLKPIARITQHGQIICEKQSRTKINSLANYVEEMSAGNTTARVPNEVSVVSTKLDHDMSSYYKIEKQLFEVYSKVMQYSLATGDSQQNIQAQFESMYEQLLIFLRNSDQVTSFFRGVIDQALFSVNRTLICSEDKSEDVYIDDCEVDSSEDEFEDHNNDDNLTTHEATIPKGTIPFLHLKKRSNVTGEWSYNKELTQMYLSSLLRMSKSGIQLGDKTVLMTTQGADDLLVLEVLKGLLQAGARVFVASQRYDHQTTSKFKECYQRHGASGSKLVLSPLNLASKIDISKFVRYYFSRYDDVDLFLPFHVKRAYGSLIDFNSKAELTHRSASLNLLRFMAGIVEEKRIRGIDTRITHVLLPLSPTHRNISESDPTFSDTFLSPILDKWYDEDWSTELSVCGCVYGWTNDDIGDDMVAHGLEKLGIRTFASNEMAFNILGLLSYQVIHSCQKGALMADLNGGLHTLPNFGRVVSQIRNELGRQQQCKEAIHEEKITDAYSITETSSDGPNYVKPRGNISPSFPNVPEYERLQKQFNGDHLSGLLDLSHTVVVTGFSEVGPWGNSRTRWEMESTGEFSLEACIELAWIMGFIEYKRTSKQSGWADVSTGEFISDHLIKQTYETRILEHTGIRIIDPSLFEGYDPSKKQMLQEIVMTRDLGPIEMSLELAEQYKAEHGDLVEIISQESGSYSQCMVRFLKGCPFFVPKALRFDRFVAGQIPSGWDATRYGIPQDIIDSVDTVTLFALVATAEALISSGITDPYELYKYVHVSEVGNCSGSGIGGLRSHHAMQKMRMRDSPVQNDILQETFINTSAAWINMLLLSSCGPIKTPVGACATALESLDSAVETILSGKAKICLAGGYDDFTEEVSYEFGQMGATSSAQTEIESGREPKEMCRPATSTRNGFMESHGSGIQVLMAADLAITMGAPIYGIVAMASTASDKISKSLPAPGKGIMTCAREVPKKFKFPCPKLNANFRRKQLERRYKEVMNWVELELAAGSEIQFVHEMAEKQIKEARRYWGCDFWHNDESISPIRGSLAIFGLTIDDLGAASFHGTSTKANEKNESEIFNSMMDHLGRSEGNPLLGVFQKHLTGHPKGAAAAWMLNGALQMLQTGIVPGNKNADNIDKVLEKYQHIAYLSENLEMECVKAVSVSSFGFGQKGAMAIVVNPNYALAALSEAQYHEYIEKLHSRQSRAQNHLVNGMYHNKICKPKSRAPFKPEEEESVFLDPLVRADQNLKLSMSETSHQRVSISRFDNISVAYESQSNDTIVQAIVKACLKAIQHFESSYVDKDIKAIIDSSNLTAGFQLILPNSKKELRVTPFYNDSGAIVIAECR
ncbi:LAMI_0C08108g1_1 [Lachancea mirantina]|uniref:Fatty acid synthase subunit alpha n=1 Tax=Lachancea mirantina TaxID=1230905 RepID=A0A1G4J4E0_9SACH|nr:LAMI_0C08108g1_1 [Lachancea mirantina]